MVARKALVLVSVLAMLLSTNVVSQLIQDQTEDFTLSTNTPVSCETILQTHRFQGTCCSLNVTVGAGCILTVTNGWCKVTGQEWTFTYTSTFDSDGATCPGSEFVVPNVEPEEPSEEVEEPKDAAPNAIVMSLLAVFVATVVATMTV